MSATTEPDRRSDGVRIESGEDVNIGGDVVGRDKITNVTNITNYYRAPYWAEVKHQRNRQAMLQNVRDFWVRGVLENSLYGAALIRLGLAYQPEAVEQPWNLILRRAEQPDQSLTPDTRIIDIFDEASGALLILGAPGSGKTTTLLELARDLLTRAEKDGTALIPVIFPLSSWAEQKLPLTEWLVDELFKRYDVPRKVGAIWVKQDMVLPLLDGLDEVQVEHREACARAINVFRAEHGLTPLIVSSRTADYEALRTQLRLRAAVVLQSLSSEQVDAHLVKLGPGATTVRSLLAVDEDLRELATTPLMLNILLVVYQDTNAENVTVFKTPDARRAYLFERYIQQMLERPAKLRVYPSLQSQSSHGDERIKVSYSTHETLHWLTWLARSMKIHSQSVFYLEWMQLSWLPGLVQQRNTVVGVSSSIGLFFGLFGGLGVGMVGRMLSAALFVFILMLQRDTGLRAMANWLPLPPLTAGQFYWPDLERDVLIFQLVAGLGGWLIFGLLFGRIGFSRQIETVEAIHWSRSHMWSHLIAHWRSTLIFGLIVGLSSGLIIGLIAGLSAGLFFALHFGQADGLKLGLISGLLLPGSFFGLIAGLSGGLIRGMLSGLVVNDLAIRKSPNEGMWRSARSALLGGLFFGLLGGLTVALISWLFFGLSSEGLSLVLPVAVLGGLAYGSFGWLIYGGRACLQHSILRFTLWRNGSTPRPWEYVQFLDYAADRVLLRKVGGGYIFVHRLLMDYFAGLEG